MKNIEYFYPFNPLQARNDWTTFIIDAYVVDEKQLTQ